MNDNCEMLFCSKKFVIDIFAKLGWKNKYEIEQ